jgi:hypothetical protein
MIEHELNPQLWFGTRELEYIPKHFTLAKTALTSESKIWILNKLSGRFSIGNKIDDSSTDFLLVSDTWFPAFEDPAEAVLYELYWS